jgi:Flp pilus assembly protein TadG
MRPTKRRNKGIERACSSRKCLSQDGGSLLETALVLPVLFLLMFGVVDLGWLYYLAIEVSEAANAAALYGSQNPQDTTGMQNAALADAQDLPNFTASSVTATYGCECSDASLPIANCASLPSCGTKTVVEYVQVTTTATYNVLFLYPGIPTSITLHGSARMRAGH